MSYLLKDNMLFLDKHELKLHEIVAIKLFMDINDIQKINISFVDHVIEPNYN